MADNDKFEQKLTRMEEISKALSNPETDLQKAVDLYEEGMKLLFLWLLLRRNPYGYTDEVSDDI